VQQELRQLPQETLPSSGVGGGKVRGSISLAVTAGIVGTGRVGGDCGDCGGENTPACKNPSSGWEKNYIGVHTCPLLKLLRWRRHQWVCKQDSLGNGQNTMAVGGWLGCLTSDRQLAVAAWDAQLSLIFLAGLEVAGWR
jgi:hypothetical protein